MNLLGRIARRIKLFALPLYFKAFDENVECNICGWKDFRFETESWHPHTVCTRCRLEVRHRLFWASLNVAQQRGWDCLDSGKKVLHFAPDRYLNDRLRKRSAKYVTADLMEEGYQYDSVDLNLDISNMAQIADGSFDVVIALDVLEHVRDDGKAIGEVYRVLSPGGCCIFMVPQIDNQQQTLEDLSDLTREERTAKFGQWDHWRIYGSDFSQKLEDAGFEVSEVSAADFPPELVSKHVLRPPERSDHPLATNDRRVYFGIKPQSAPTT